MNCRRKQKEETNHQSWWRWPTVGQCCGWRWRWRRQLFLRLLCLQFQRCHQQYQAHHHQQWTLLRWSPTHSWSSTPLFPLSCDPFLLLGFQTSLPIKHNTTHSSSFFKALCLVCAFYPLHNTLFIDQYHVFQEQSHFNQCWITSLYWSNFLIFFC